jgi:hypothetical protein
MDFLKCLVEYAKQKVFLIVNNMRVHHAEAVMAWLAQQNDETEIFYLRLRVGTQSGRTSQQ